MKTILIVEDNPLNMELACQLLEDDYTILRAEDGYDAVKLAIQQVPDLILMDLSLPRLDGWQATTWIRREERTRHIPVIAMTAHAVQDSLSRALAAGCCCYLTKPVDEDALLEEVRRRVGP